MKYEGPHIEPGTAKGHKKMANGVVLLKSFALHLHPYSNFNIQQWRCNFLIPTYHAYKNPV